MATDFPTSLDSLTNPNSTDGQNSPSHSTQHSNANDAIEALETKVGVNSSAVTTTHDYKLSSVTSSAKAVSTAGAQTIADVKTFDEGAIVTAPKAYSPSAAGTATLDLALGNDFEITMPAGNITIALSNATVGEKFLVSILQDAVGSRTVTWFTTIRWGEGSVPTLTTTASKRDYFWFKVTGSGTYDGVVVSQNH